MIMMVVVVVVEVVVIIIVMILVSGDGMEWNVGLARMPREAGGRAEDELL
jgi:hypothetical protein